MKQSSLKKEHEQHQVDSGDYVTDFGLSQLSRQLFVESGRFYRAHQSESKILRKP